jgi:TetR/AcrR family transcriptional regulator, transcriptional repressor for nem operon
MQQTTTATKTSARTRLLDLAESAIISKGFAATSIDELVAGAGITKSGFFYHFKDKSELARALLQRHIEHDQEILDNLFRRARELHEDPLHSYLVGLKLFAELLSDLPETWPGCLVAAICYQDQLFNREIRELNASSLQGWRRRFREHLDEIAERYSPRIAVDLDDLADMVGVMVEGGIVLSKVLKEPQALARQILLYRSFVRSIFAGS